jgi:hypothetical protein
MRLASIISEERLWWVKRRYLLSHNALTTVIRAKLLKASTYLIRYLYRSVNQEKDILVCENGEVTFRYCISKSKQWGIERLPGQGFCC